MTPDEIDTLLADAARFEGVLAENHAAEALLVSNLVQTIRDLRAENKRLTNEKADMRDEREAIKIAHYDDLQTTINELIAERERLAAELAETQDEWEKDAHEWQSANADLKARLEACTCKP